MTDRGTFVGEPLTPEFTEAADSTRMGAGEPALPGAFRWRAERLTVAGVNRRWKDHGPCRHGSGEMYLRKHWFELATGDGRTMTVYFERQPGSRRSGKSARSRWRLFSISGGETAGT